MLLAKPPIGKEVWDREEALFNAVHLAVNEESYEAQRLYPD